MRIAPLLAGAFVALSMVAVATPSNAAPSVPNYSTADSAVVAVRHGGPHWRHHHWRHRHWGGPRIVINACRAWRHECANRWPGLGWRYQRCLRNHGC